MSSVINLLRILLYSRSLQFSAVYLQGATEGALDPLPCVYYRFTLLRHFRAPLRAKRFLECPCYVFQFSSCLALWLVKCLSIRSAPHNRLSYRGLSTFQGLSNRQPVLTFYLSFRDYMITRIRKIVKLFGNYNFHLT